jgi:uncharacterized membrane protein YesL
MLLLACFDAAFFFGFINPSSELMSCLVLNGTIGLTLLMADLLFFALFSWTVFFSF